MIELLAFLAILFLFVGWPLSIVTFAAMWEKAFGYSWLTSFLLGILSTLPIIGIAVLAVLAFSKWTGDQG